MSVSSDGHSSDSTEKVLLDCDKPGCTRERHTSNGYFCREHRVGRPPCQSERALTDTTHHDDLERRVCPDCRLFFDVGSESDAVFCSTACRRRYDRGEFV